MTIGHASESVLHHPSAAGYGSTTPDLPAASDKCQTVPFGTTLIEPAATASRKSGTFSRTRIGH